MSDLIRAKADVLFELSWEVCNKVGGIYTVIMSKASLMNNLYKDYYLIGPYFKDKAEVDFEELPVPDNMKKVFDVLSHKGIHCYYGKWLIKGEPKAILIDYRSLVVDKNDIKRWFWDNYKIDSLHSGWDFEEPMLWSWASGLLIELLQREVFSGKKIVTHHHEWLAGFSLLYLKNKGVPVASVFTTHATMLGRVMASANIDIYSVLDKINPYDESYKFGVQDKFLTEKASALNADVFTTVSEITAVEAEKILGRNPEVLVLNGLDVDRFPTIEETSIKHVTSRERLREFLTYYFYPYYHNFRLDHNLMFAFLGRYEFKNKGMDVFIEALGKLNNKLKEEDSDRTITAFFWVPNLNFGVKTELLENKNYYRHIKSYVEWHSKEIVDKIIIDFITSDDPLKDSIFTKEFLHNMRKDVFHFKRNGNPPLVTHNLRDESNDVIIKSFLANGLDNSSSQKVKVILYPCYLDGDDSLINLPYYEAIAGTHLTVFPSYYEPWGYTPLESIAMGVPTITSDLAGFGRFIKPKLLPENPGVFVLERFGKSHDEEVDSLFRLLYDFSLLDHAERVENKINAKEISQLADWAHLIKNYIKAHNLAIDKKK